jgi:M-phase inducer tyrosine phosphatase
MLPPTVTMPSSPDPDASSSFDMPDYSSPAQAYAIRQQIKTKTLRRCDGTDNFKATSTIGGMDISDSPSTSRFLKAGIPGFGDNESHGKLLPCHRVSEDGLMRIVPETVSPTTLMMFNTNHVNISWTCYLTANTTRKLQTTL